MNRLRVHFKKFIFIRYSCAVVVDVLFIVVPIVCGGCVYSLFYHAILDVLSSLQSIC